MEKIKAYVLVSGIHLSNFNYLFTNKLGNSSLLPEDAPVLWSCSFQNYRVHYYLLVCHIHVFERSGWTLLSSNYHIPIAKFPCCLGISFVKCLFSQIIFTHSFDHQVQKNSWHLCLVASVMSDSLWLHWLQPTWLLCPWGILQEYWSGCHALLQGIFPTQGSNPGLLHCGQILY